MADIQIASDIVSWAVGIPSVGVVIAYGISIIKRRVQADSKSMFEDKSYQDMLETYRKERDAIKDDRDRIMARMHIIENERNDAVSKVGKLSAEVEFLSTQVNELKTLVEKLGTNLEAARTELQKFAVENAKLAALITLLEEKQKLISGE
jgi:chromosome segregation ATPase